METNPFNIEHFIFDKVLIQIAENFDSDKFDEYKKSYPGHEEIIDKALLLLQYLNINYVQITQNQIDKDYQQLFAEIKRRKRKRISMWWTATAVACACLVFMLTVVKDVYFPLPDYKQQAFAMLDSADTDVEEIQIVSGITKVAVVNNEDSIKQTEDGHIVIGKEQKVKSADLAAEFVQLVVPNGKRTSITFQDGTIVWLNSGSKLVYPKIFAKDKREIFVEGEIYLEVNKDTERPFLVNTKKFSVTVLGTRFNINAYNGDSESSVVLIEGSVEVDLQHKKQKLSPNQGLFVREGSTQVKQIDPEIYTGWKDGIMKVNGETLENMFVRLSRHYNVQIQCSDQIILKERYKGKLSLLNSLDNVLYSLSLSTPFEIRKLENDIIQIYGKSE